MAPTEVKESRHGVAREGGALVAPANVPARRGRLRWWRDVRRRRMLAVADVATGAVAALALQAGPWVFAGIPAWLLFAKLFGLYDRDHRVLRHLTIDELPSIAALAAAGVATLAVIARLDGNEQHLAWRVALALAVAVGAGLIFRATARRIWRKVTAPEITVVLGEGRLAASIQRQLRLFDDMHLELIDGAEPLELLGGNGSAAELAELAGRVDRMIVASENVDAELLDRIAAFCREAEVKLSVVSPLGNAGGPAPQLAKVANLAVVDYDTWDVPRSTLIIKRAFDVFVALFLLLLAGPLLPLIWLAIRLDSSGRAIFSQVRAGLEGRPFRMYKFRTMTSDAEARLDEVVSLDDLTEPMFKIERDPRVTGVGRWLRRFSFDEIPQLINVLRGDMSMVGPRPEQVELVDRYGPEHRFRLEVKPGITGPMQIHGRGTLTFAERLAVEHDYIEHMSLGRDLRILFLTVPAIVRGTGAF